jgi:hypothetical protein
MDPSRAFLRPSIDETDSDLTTTKTGHPHPKTVKQEQQHHNILMLIMMIIVIITDNYRSRDPLHALEDLALPLFEVRGGDVPGGVEVLQLAQPVRHARFGRHGHRCHRLPGQAGDDSQGKETVNLTGFSPGEMMQSVCQARFGSHVHRSRQLPGQARDDSKSRWIEGGGRFGERCRISQGCFPLDDL